MSKGHPYEIKLLKNSENSKESKNIKKYNNEELNNIRDDILQYVKDHFQEYSSKLQVYLLRVNTIEKNFEEKTSIINSNYNNIIKTQANINSKLDKIKDYESFYNKTNDKLISHEIRLNNFRDDFSKATQKYDKIYLDNLELPGYIGRCAKYKNCQMFFNDIIKDISSFNQYKEKNTLDLKSYKDKLENLIKSINTLVDNNNKSQIKYINKLNQKNVDDCQNMLDTLGQRIFELKVENAKYSTDIMNKSDELSKKWNRIEEIKKEIFNEFDYKIREFKKINEDIFNKFNEFKNEYRIIRDKFFELAEFIKDIRFKKNIKYLYGEIIKKKEIKDIYNSLNDINNNKSQKGENNQNENNNMELLQDISSVSKMDFKNNDSLTDNKIEKSGDMTPKKLKENAQNNKSFSRRSIDFNSHLSINNGIDKINSIKNNKINNDIKYINYYPDNYDNYNNAINIEKEEHKNNSDIFVKNKKNQRIVINSKEENKKKNEEIKNPEDKEVENNNNSISNKKTLNNTLSISSKKKNSKNEDSNTNTNTVDNQTTYTNANNSINDNNMSFSSVSAFNLYNSNKNIVFNDICLDSNDKVIKELASELEQSTAKKDLASNKKEEKFKINKNIIEPLNLVKTIQEEKEFPGSSSLRDKTFLNSYRDRESSDFSNKNQEKKNYCLNKLINNKENNETKDILEYNNNELLLYGDNPREIEKKFIMTDQKIFDLEEYTKEKIEEILSKIEKLNKIQNKYNNKNSIKNVNSSMKEKNSFNSYRGILGYNDKIKIEKKNSISNIGKSNIFKGLKLKEGDSSMKKHHFNYDKKFFDSTCQNFHKNKLYNLEKINQKIFNSSCKKIKICTNINEFEKKFLHTTKAREFNSNKKDNALSENEKKNNNGDNNLIKDFELKKGKCRNNSSGNLYLTQKRGESLSIHEADIKLVYLNKFVNNQLPFIPVEPLVEEDSIII